MWTQHLSSVQMVTEKQVASQNAFLATKLMDLDNHLHKSFENIFKEIVVLKIGFNPIKKWI